MTKAEFRYQYAKYLVQVFDKDDYCWAVSFHPTLHDAYSFIMREMRFYQGVAYKITAFTDKANRHYMVQAVLNGFTEHELREYIIGEYMDRKKR